MIVLHPRFFCPEMIVQLVCLARNLRLKVKYFRATFIIKKSFDTPTSGGVSLEWLFDFILRVILTNTQSMVSGL